MDCGVPISVGVRGLQQIRLGRRHAAEGIRWTSAGNGAFVAMDAAVVTDLQEERAVAETIASLDAFCAADAKALINRVFVIRVFDERALNGGGRAKLILGGGGKRVWFGLEVAGAEIAVAAHREGVNALYGGLFENTFGGAVAAADAFLRVNLPDPLLRLGATG